MQREMIYLREIDSVLKSKKEVIAGQEKMYDAIVNRGYCVVISLNQLTDAPAFLGPIKSKCFEESMEFYMKLFENGSLKISRFTSPDDGSQVRTAAQYVLNSLGKLMDKKQNGDTFIFSSLPITKENTRALKKVYEAIKYSDLDLLKNLDHLFGAESAYIQRYVKWILQLSIQSSFYTDVKKTAYLGFLDYMKAIFASREELLLTGTMPAGFDEAMDILVNTKCLYTEEAQRRSKWYEGIKAIQGKAPEVAGLAIAIVDLCYNLSVESSISGIDREYHTDKDAFIRVFGQMLSEMPVHPAGAKQKNEVIEPEEYPDWAFAVRITDESYNLAHAKEGVQRILHPRGWKRICLAGQFLKFGRAWIYYFIFLGMEILSGIMGTLMEKAGDRWFSAILAQPLVRTLIYSVIVVTGISFLNSKTSHRFSIPDIEDIVGNIRNSVSDSMRILKGDRYKERNR